MTQSDGADALTIGETTSLHSKKRVLSGMRPTGRLHIGHYFGALQNWLKLQEVWYVPNTWDTSYEWDLEWLKDPLVSLRARFQHYIEQLSSF